MATQTLSFGCRQIAVPHVRHVRCSPHALQEVCLNAMWYYNGTLHTAP